MSRTLFDAPQELADQRGRKGRQIPLPAILALAVAAILAGAYSLIAIFRWGRRLPPEALRVLGFPDGAASCHGTYQNVFLSLDAEAPSRMLGRFALGDASPGHIAIDGKTLIRERGADYFLFVKAKQPELRSELEKAFGDVSPCVDDRGDAGAGRRRAA